MAVLEGADTSAPVACPSMEIGIDSRWETKKGLSGGTESNRLIHIHNSYKGTIIYEP